MASVPISTIEHGSLSAPAIRATPEQQVSLEPIHFGFIDALRGIAILGVIMVHAELATPALTGHVRNILSCGNYGVQLFFVVSAASLFGSLEHRSKRDSKPIAAFFVRRLARVAPLFWIAAAFYTWHPTRATIETVPNGITKLEVAATLLFVHGFHPLTLNTVVPGGWSIADEAIFYCLLPVLFARVHSLRSALWLFALTTALVGFFSPEALRVLHHFTPGLAPSTVGFFANCNFVNQLPVFECGIILAFLLRHDEQGLGKIIRYANSSSVSASFLISTSSLLVFQLIPDQVFAAIGFMLLALAVCRNPKPWIVNRYTISLGKISFSIYIWHFVVLNLIAPKVITHLHLHGIPYGVNAVVQTTVIILLVLLITTPIATLSYWLIEQTGIKLGKRALRSLAWA